MRIRKSSCSRFAVTISIAHAAITKFLVDFLISIQFLQRRRAKLLSWTPPATSRAQVLGLSIVSKFWLASCIQRNFRSSFHAGGTTGGLSVLTETNLDRECCWAQQVANTTCRFIQRFVSWIP